jgi:hypothetical protein
MQFRRSGRHASTTIRANLQPDRFRRFFDADGVSLKLKAPDFRDGCIIIASM